MTKTVLENWLDESEENRRLYAQEDLILQVTEAIWERMSELNVSKKDLAEKLGRSKSYITQVLSGSRNMTLRTLADIAFTLDMEPKFILNNEENIQMQQVYVEMGKLLSEKLVIVAGNDDHTEWSSSNSISSRPRLKAVA